MNLLETAFYWKSRGIATLPIRYKDKKPSTKLLPDGQWEKFKTELPSDNELLSWFSSSLRNIGLIVGWSNLLVIDFDNLTEYNKWLLWTYRKGQWAQEIAQKTYQVHTARGIHLYVYSKEKEINRKLPGIDIKAQGGYVLIPPSIHPSGAIYTCTDEIAPILTIDCLSDIFPAEMLLNSQQDTEFQNPGIAAIMSKINRTRSNDPWESATNRPDPSQDMITQVRQHHHILDYLPDAERTSRDGRWWRAACPFHSDKNPSFWVDALNGICGCFGGCTHKPLDVINLYARLNGINNVDAIHDLVNNWM